MAMKRNVPFSTWMRVLQSLINEKQVDVDLSDVLGLDFTGAHAQGIPPEDFFGEQLRPALEELGFSLELHGLLDHAAIAAMNSDPRASYGESVSQRDFDLAS